ncbi:MAG: hypothetical protein ACRCX5_02130, partial [Bacteroidales bacterium]
MTEVASVSDNDAPVVVKSNGEIVKTKWSAIWEWIKGKILGESGMEATSERRGLMSATDKSVINRTNTNNNAYCNY